eukprot:NODE_855_length_3679_cov_0.601117.p3 type:complete len:105 gc:universal NODE_855_length_3679_cov_0.601117:1552-1866(+)
MLVSYSLKYCFTEDCSSRCSKILTGSGYSNINSSICKLCLYWFFFKYSIEVLNRQSEYSLRYSALSNALEFSFSSCCSNIPKNCTCQDFSFFRCFLIVYAHFCM